MQAERTLLLNRSDVEQLLDLRDCVDAVEEIFRLQGNGKVPASEILGVKAPGGGLHVKAVLLPRERNYFVAKLNTNFPGNRTQSSLPTIQGLIVVYNADNGCPLAILDSIDITIKRTAAASAVAAKYLARKNSSIATIVGCGDQAPAQLRAMQTVLPLTKVHAFDSNQEAAKNFVTTLENELELEIEAVKNLQRAIQKSDVCITCTPANEFFVRKEDVVPGTFIAAVGADAAHKQEIDPALMASAKVIADSREQCCTVGDTHHAIAQGLMCKEHIYAELGEIVAGQKTGRTRDDEIIIFDSTGVAIEDAVTAITVYEKARAAGRHSHFEFAI